MKIIRILILFMPLFCFSQQEEVYGLIDEGDAFVNSGNYNKAIDKYTACLKIYESVSNKSGVAYNLVAIGTCYRKLKKIDEAITSYKKALKYYEELKDEKGIAAVTLNIANTYNESGNDSKAIRWFLSSADAYSNIKKEKTVYLMYKTVGVKYANKGDFTNAEKYLIKAKNIAKEENLSSELVDIEKVIAKVSSNKDIADITTEYQDEQLQLQKEHLESVEIANEKSMEEISHLSSENQVIALKSRLEQEKYLQELDQHKLKSEADSLELGLKNSEIALHKEEKATADALANIRTAQLSAAIVGIALLAVLAILILVGYRQKRKNFKMLQEKNKTIEEQNKNINKSIGYAHKIQTAVLNPIDNLAELFSESFIFFQPKDVVSGDFYWFYEKNNRKLIVAADCTGHGVPGAFMSLIGHSLFDQAAIEEGLMNPSEILQYVSDKLIEKLRQEDTEDAVRDSIDLAMYSFNTKTNEVIFSGAKNNLYHISDNKLEEYKGDRRTVGYGAYSKQIGFTDQQFKVKKGDRIYVFSDGYADQKGGENRKKFKYKPFKELLERTSSLPIKEQSEVLSKEINTYKANVHQIDDILIVGVEI